MLSRKLSFAYACVEVLKFYNVGIMPEGELTIAPEELSDEYLNLFAWQEKANCANKDRDIFFAGQGENAKVAEAKAVCEECDVRMVMVCLEYAVRNPQTLGIWGGTTARERCDIRKQRAELARLAIQQSELNSLES